MNIRKLIALNIYTLRNKHKLTQEQFAKKLNIDITRGHISRIENGNNIPSAEFIKAVCSTFHVSADWLLGNEPYVNDSTIFTDDELGLISQYRRLPSKIRIKLNELINSILELS